MFILESARCRYRVIQRLKKAEIMKYNNLKKSIETCERLTAKKAHISNDGIVCIFGCLSKDETKAIENAYGLKHVKVA